MDARRLSLYRWAKQNLASRAPRADWRRLLKEDLGLHSTDYLTPYLSLWARVRDFEPRSLFDDLNQSRAAVRLRAFRGTVFVVHRDNLTLVLAGLRPWYSTIRAAIEKQGRKSGQNFRALERRVRRLLSGRKLMSASALNKDLRTTSNRDIAPFFLRYLEFGGVLVRIGQDHAEDRTGRYGLLTDWFPEVSLAAVDPKASVRELALAYIRRFGPVCFDDLCWWLPLPKTAGRRLIQDLRQHLEFFSLNGREYMMAGDEFPRFEKFERKDGPPVVRLLPYEDHFPKAYARRDEFLSPEAADLLMGKRKIELGQIRPSIWLDGQAIGRWEVERPAKGGAASVAIKGFIKSVSRSKNLGDAVETERRCLEVFLSRKLLPLCGAKEET